MPIKSKKLLKSRKQTPSTTDIIAKSKPKKSKSVKNNKFR